MKALTTVAARVLLALIFVISGLEKIGGYAATQAYMKSHGVPGALLPLVILTEVGGGLMVVLGWQTRIAAVLLAGFTLIAALIFHTHFADPLQVIMFMLHLSIVGGFLLLAVHGGGECSLDQRRKT